MLVENKDDLIYHLTSKPIASSKPMKSVMVKAKVRANILTDEMQGTFIHKGSVKRFVFKSIGGGVYEALIGEL